MKDIMEQWREYSSGDATQTQLDEGLIDDAMSWVKEKGAAAKEATIDFFQKLKVELGETKEGALLLAKMVRGEQLTPEEEQALTTQAQDIGKGLPLLAIFVLPGGGIAAAALVKLAKKFGVDLMPTAFADETNESPIKERAVNVGPIWRKFKPELQAAMAEFMTSYLANQNEVEGLEDLNQERLVTAMTTAATSEVSKVCLVVKATPTKHGILNAGKQNK